MKIFVLRLQPFLWNYNKICWCAEQKTKKPMENVSLTWSIWKSLALSVLEPDSPRGNCELLPWRVLGVWVTVLKDMDMQTETKTARHEGHGWQLSPARVAPAHFYCGFVVHQAGASWWLIWCIDLTRLWDTQKAGKTSVLGVSVKAFSKE